MFLFLIYLLFVCLFSVVSDCFYYWNSNELKQPNNNINQDNKQDVLIWCNVRFSSVKIYKLTAPDYPIVREQSPPPERSQDLRQLCSKIFRLIIRIRGQIYLLDIPYLGNGRENVLWGMTLTTIG